MTEVSMESLQTRVVALEMAVTALQAQAKKGGGQAPAAAPAQAFRPFSDEQLGATWADKTVRKDPKFWKGASYAGQTYSECSPEFLDCLAEQLEWSASRDKDNPDAKKKTNGKFWWEADEFEAKLCRSWAAKHRRVAAEAAAAPLPSGDDAGDLPF